MKNTKPVEILKIGLKAQKQKDYATSNRVAIELLSEHKDKIVVRYFYNPYDIWGYHQGICPTGEGHPSEQPYNCQEDIETWQFHGIVEITITIRYGKLIIPAPLVAVEEFNWVINNAQMEIRPIKDRKKIERKLKIRGGQSKYI